MIQLIKYFSILFLSTKISRERLKDFAEDHIARLNANNPGGIFTVILTDVTTAFTNYFGDITSESLNLALQEGKTVAMNESRDALCKLISKNENLIAYQYSANMMVYQEFYPLGITEYTEADLPTLETKGKRYLDVLALHAADFTAAFVADYTVVYKTYVENRNFQKAAMCGVAAEKRDLATTKPALCKQLTYNLLTIAREFLGDESAGDVYFNQAILNAAFKEADSRIENDINPMTTQNVFDNTAGPDTKYKISVSGDGTIVVGFADGMDVVITPATGKVIDNTTALTFKASEMGYTSAKKYLNVTSQSSITLSFVIERV